MAAFFFCTHFIIHDCSVQPALYTGLGAKLSTLAGVGRHAICRSLRARAVRNQRSGLRAGGLGLLQHAVWDFESLSTPSYRSTFSLFLMATLTKQSPKSFLLCSSSSDVHLFVFISIHLLPFIKGHLLY